MRWAAGTLNEEIPHAEAQRKNVKITKNRKYMVDFICKV
jgi:hypothetical protein